MSHQDLTWRMSLFVVILVVMAAAAAATASLQAHRILMGITVDAEEDATMKTSLSCRGKLRNMALLVTFL